MGCGSSVESNKPTNTKAVNQSVEKIIKVQEEEKAKDSSPNADSLVKPNYNRQATPRELNGMKKSATHLHRHNNSDFEELMLKKVPTMLILEPEPIAFKVNIISEEETGQIIETNTKPKSKFATMKREDKNDATERIPSAFSPIAESPFEDRGLAPENIQRQKNKQKKKFQGALFTYEKIYENVSIEEKEPDDHDLDFIYQSFKKHFVFFSLSQLALEALVKEMFYCVIKKDQYVFKQGDQASSYFVIQTGQIEVLIDDKFIRFQYPGESFGELSLLYGAQRSASVLAKTDCSFWALDRVKFRSAIEALISQEMEENRRFIEEVPFFQFMTGRQKDTIASSLITNRFTPGTNIVTQGEQADSYYIIKSGEVSIWKNDKELRKMGQKDSFGEQALYIKSVRMATVKADNEVYCLSLGRDTLTQILGDKIQIIIFNNIMRWSFNVSEQLNKLTDIQTEKLTQNCQISNYLKGDVVQQKEQICEKLIIVLEGGIIDSTTKQQVVKKGQCFGDEYLLQENRAKHVKWNLEVEQDSVLATLDFSKLFQLLGGDLESVLKKNEISHEKKIQILGAKKISDIKVEDLIFIKKLGQGQFGTVYLVQQKDDQNKAYALKSVSKAQVIEQNLEKHIQLEKNVLEMIHYPFIMSFIRTFKDDISVYFLVEYIKGMELFDVIRDIGLLSISDTQFYVGSMILGIEYLHSKHIIYRDIKPENIMIDHNGFLLLIDMGTAKPLLKQKNYRTFTIIGTPHYMAPEVMASKGYSFQVDLWSIGICAYEFLCGGVPYAEDADDPYEIYNEIIRSDLQWPPFFKDKKSKKFIEQLLSKQPETRLGTSYASLKANSWFDDFDWDDLFNRETIPPYVPPINKIISDKELKQKFSEGRLVVNEIIADQQASKKHNLKIQSKIQDWDKEF